MIPLPLLEQLTGTDKIERGTSSNNLCIRTNKKRVKRKKESKEEGKSKQSCFLCCLTIRKNKCILSFDEYGYSNNIINSTIMFYKCIY